MNALLQDKMTNVAWDIIPGNSIALLSSKLSFAKMKQKFNPNIQLLN